MKQTLSLLICIFCAITVFAQNRGRIQESNMTDKKGEYRNLTYTRELGTGTAKDYGFFYKTEYSVFDANGSPVIVINLVHYKNKGVVEIYIYPYYNWKRQDNMLQSYIIDPKNFVGLSYSQASSNPTKSVNQDGSEKRSVGIRFLSNKKENLLLEEIDSKLFDLHYRIVH
jgi:hypothetical protein